MSEEVTKLEAKVVTVTDKAPTVEKTLDRTIGGKNYSMPFTMNTGTTLDHCVAVAEAIAASQSTDKEKVDSETILAKYFFGAYDLQIRAKLAPQLEAQVEGPGKQIDKAAKALSAALGITESEARDLVVKQRQDRGLEV